MRPDKAITGRQWPFDSCKEDDAKKNGWVRLFGFNFTNVAFARSSFRFQLSDSVLPDPLGETAQNRSDWTVVGWVGFLSTPICLDQWWFNGRLGLGWLSLWLKLVMVTTALVGAGQGKFIDIPCVPLNQGLTLRPKYSNIMLATNLFL